MHLGGLQTVTLRDLPPVGAAALGRFRSNHHVTHNLVTRQQFSALDDQFQRIVLDHVTGDIEEERFVPHWIAASLTLRLFQRVPNSLSQKTNLNVMFCNRNGLRIERPGLRIGPAVAVAGLAKIVRLVKYELLLSCAENIRLQYQVANCDLIGLGTGLSAEADWP